MEYVSDSDDEEIPEDEAFNSEDERKYGSFFAGKNHADEDDSEEESDSDSDDGLASDEENEEGDGGQYMLDLLNQLESKPSSASTRNGALAVHVPESEFAASVIRGTALTLDSLMEGLEDTKGFREMQKTLTEVARGKSTSVPLARVVSNRAQRKVHYEEQSHHISQWMEAVQENRQAESLDFRHKERMDLTKEDLVGKFEPTTAFEKELHAALQQAGQEDEEAILKQEEQKIQDDDLGSNKLTMEEFKRRRAQMAKMRALMFYHEQKRHHINKIKSKKYRRIRKKQRERQKNAEIAAQVDEDPDLEKELEEKEEIERMKERMTLAHKNTSKWAKRVLKRGKNVDVDTRRALSAQLKRGDDLRKKMNAARDDDEDEDDENEDLVDTARRVLADTEEDHIPMKNQGLFKLAFMQRGIDAQRERAKAEARQLLQELEANCNEQEEDDGGFQDESHNISRSTKKKVATAAQMKEVLTGGKLVATSLEFGKSNSIAISGGIDIDLSEPGDGSLGVPALDALDISARTSEHTSTLKVSDNSDGIAFTLERVAKGSLSECATPDREHAGSNPTEDSNPWLVQTNASKDPVSNNDQPNRKKKKIKGIVDVNGAVALLGDEEQDGRKQKGAGSIDDESASNKMISSLTQEELVQRAFASAPADATEAFAKEKVTVVERDDPIRNQQSSKTVSGWGSWTGKGAAPPKPPRKLPNRSQPPEKQPLPKRKRQDDKKPNVIINEKRLRKTANQFQIAHIPYPYQSREEYERAMTGAVGKEWNVTSGVKNMTRPEIMTRAGKIIQPISKRVKQRRPAAKF